MNKKNLSFRLSTILLCLLFIATAFTGCQTPIEINQSGAKTETLQDFPIVINEITVSSKPKKVAVLSGSIADIIIALGYETSLIIVTEDCTQPELEALPKIGIDESQKIIDAGADLVLANSFTADQTATFTAASIPVVAITGAKNREDFERLYSQIASSLNGANSGYSKGIETAQKIFTSLDDLSRIIPESDTVVTACFLFDTESSAITGDMLGSTLLTYSGITNIFQGASNGVYEFEKLRVTNPDIIFCAEGVKDKLINDPKFAKLHAVTNKNIYEIPAAYMLWEGRTVITAATYFAGIAHPELLHETSATVTLPEGIEESKTTSGSSGSSDTSNFSNSDVSSSSAALENSDASSSAE